MALDHFSFGDLVLFTTSTGSPRLRAVQLASPEACPCFIDQEFEDGFKQSAQAPVGAAIYLAKIVELTQHIVVRVRAHAHFLSGHMYCSTNSRVLTHTQTRGYDPYGLGVIDKRYLTVTPESCQALML